MSNYRKVAKITPTVKIFGAMHFIYYTNRLMARKVDSTDLGC